jgi:hypothetical protein
MAAAGIFCCFYNLYCSAISMIAVTQGGEFIEVVDSNLYYFIQRVYAQEGDEEVTGGESVEVDR